VAARYNVVHTNSILQEARIITVPSTSGATHLFQAERLRVEVPTTCERWALEPVEPIVSLVMPLAHMHSPCVQCIRSHAHVAHTCCCRCQANHTVLLTVGSPCTSVILRDTVGQSLHSIGTPLFPRYLQLWNLCPATHRPNCAAFCQSECTAFVVTIGPANFQACACTSSS
jgi:hypothetical protein